MHHTLDSRKCEEVIRALGDLLSREMAPDDERRAEEHLRLCEECLRHFQFERSLLDHLRARVVASEYAPPSLRSRIRQVLESA